MNRFRAFVIGSIFAALGHGAHAESLGLRISELTGGPVRYVAANSLGAFPVPVVVWRRAGLMRGVSEKREIEQRVIYPLIRKSPKPVSTVLVEFQPATDAPLGIVVVWTDGSHRESSIPRTPSGKYDAKAYELLFAKPTP